MALVQTQRLNPGNGFVSNIFNNGTVSNSAIMNSAINNSAINNSAINSGAINNGTINNPTISNGAINSDTFNNSAINSAINNSATSNGAINNGAITSGTINNRTTSNGAFNNGVLNSGINNNSAINNGAINNSATSSGAINSGAINSGAINSGAINNSVINSGAINNSAISNGAIASGTINNRTISNGAINNGVLNGGVNNNNSAINNGATINNSAINNSAINNIATNNGAINNRTINNDTINNRTINNGTINNRTMNNGTINNSTTSNDNASNSTRSSGTNITTASPVWPRFPPAVIGLNTSTLPSIVTLTPPQNVTASQVSITATVTAPTTSLPSVVECPALNGSITNNTNNSSSISSTSSSSSSNKPGGSTNKSSLHLSTNERKTGTVVEAECLVAKGGPQNVTYLQCQENGIWNSSLPECSDSFQFTTFQLYFSVAGFVFGLTMVVLAALICYAMKLRRNISSSSADSNEESEKTIYVDPYFVTEAIPRPPPRGNFGRRETTYAKPAVYTTYLNQSYYEDAYDRWRMQEQSVSERLYDSPWARPRGLKSQMDTPDFKWSRSNLKNLGESGFKRLPRAQLSVDHTSINSNDSIGPTSSTYSRDPLLNQSTASARKIHPPKRRYTASVDSTSQSQLDNTVTGVQDDLDASGHFEFDHESKDGLTNF